MPQAKPTKHAAKTAKPVKHAKPTKHNGKPAKKLKAGQESTLAVPPKKPAAKPTSKPTAKPMQRPTMPSGQILSGEPTPRHWDRDVPGPCRSMLNYNGVNTNGR